MWRAESKRLCSAVHGLYDELMVNTCVPCAGVSCCMSDHLSYFLALLVCSIAEFDLSEQKHLPFSLAISCFLSSHIDFPTSDYFPSLFICLAFHAN